jgi:hypothetical protein
VWGKKKIPATDTKVSQWQVVTDLQTGLDQYWENTPWWTMTYHTYITNALRQVYQDHSDKIQSWAMSFPTHKLVMVNVDAPGPDLVAHWIMYFFLLPNNTKNLLPLFLHLTDDHHEEHSYPSSQALSLA